MHFPLESRIAAVVVITSPQALFLLVLLPLVALAGHRRVRRLSGVRGALALTLRLLIMALLVAALAGPQRLAGSAAVGSAVVFLVDTSASVGAAGQAAALAWARRAVRTAGAHDQAGLVLVGSTARLVTPLSPHPTFPPAGRPAAATDIAAALRLGLALLPPAQPGRLVLLSDGRPTTGDTTAALAQARLRGVPVDTVALAPARPRDAAVAALDAPPLARVGDVIALHITLHATTRLPATVHVDVDGVGHDLSVHLPAGDTNLSLQQRLLAPGVHTFRVSVRAAGDAVPQDDVLEAATVAGPPGRVLFVAPGRNAGVALRNTLTAGGLTLVSVLPGALPAAAGSYSGDDAVVLDDVPATALTAGQQRALQAAVHEGLGLLAVGGTTAFGAGHYPHTPLEGTLPVTSILQPRRVRVPLALMLVVDQSGSMIEQVNGVDKLSMAKVAAASAFDRLDDGDGVGVLSFDDTNHVIVPFHVLHGAADKARSRALVGTIVAGGGTTIYPALQEAEHDLLRMATAYRHVVLLTDGQGEDAPFGELIRRMRHEGITVSTIGVGEDVDEAELRLWAQLGGGNFHDAADPHAVPRIVLSEARFGVANTAAVQARIPVGVSASTPLLRSLSNTALPPVAGYNTTRARPAAQVDVQTAGGAPLLASWQYGLGRAVAWTADDGATRRGWAGAWSAARLPAFWVDAVRWALRGYLAGPLSPLLQQDDASGTLRIVLAPDALPVATRPTVRLTGPHGTVQTVGLVATEPGQYTAWRPLEGPGLYTAVLQGPHGPLGAPWDVAALAVPYSPDYAPSAFDPSLLASIAAATGGRVRTSPVGLFATTDRPRTPVWQPLWPFLLVLALLLFPLDVAVRLLQPPHPGRGRKRALSQ